jgi:predicted aminopeptidase
LLNTFLEFNEATVAETLFHELAHQRVFARGDTDFNEAYATVVGREGARRWMRSRGESDALHEWEKSVELEDSYVATALAARDRLQDLYSRYDGTRPSASREEGVRAQKRDVLSQLAADLAALSGSNTASAGEWNHARLNSLATYYELVPAFEDLLAVHGGDLRAFHEDVGRIADLPASERVAALRGQGN